MATCLNFPFLNTELENSLSKLNAIKHIVSTPFGTANLLEGASVLVRAGAAGVTASQLRAIYPADLRTISDDEINGFTRFSGRLLRREVSISSKLWQEEKPSSSSRRRER